MSAADCEQVRKSEVRFPSDLVHNGHQYIRGCRRESPTLTRAVRRIRSSLCIAELQAVLQPQILRVHRVEEPRGSRVFPEGDRSRVGWWHNLSRSYSQDSVGRHDA